MHGSRKTREGDRNRPSYPVDWVLSDFARLSLEPRPF